ncbi:MAG TPA: Na+/H+ antiporter NhaC family protein [Tepidisphaeraceae bacterium]|nr:Na+/H+ antiporter NhaC family protein [Tepidisphaeraceae bacterium]
MAIVLAIVTRQVYLSLGGGVWLGWTILNGWNPLSGLAAAIDGCVAVLADAGNARMLLFMLVIGGLIATVEASGGVRGFVADLERREWVNSPRPVRLLTFLVGVVIFIESTITILVCGAIGRPLADRYRVSREKLAYLIDSTSAPVCILIPLNAWGAYVLGILALPEMNVADPLGTFVASIPYNFYAWGALILAGMVALTGWNLGPMTRADARTRSGELLWPGATPMVDPDVIAPPVETTIPPRAANMLIPIGVMVLMMPASLLITGGGDMRAGSGSTSVLWAVLAGLAVAWIMLLIQRAFTVNGLTKLAIHGAGGLVGLALLMLLALALAAVANKLGTGAYIANLTAGTMPPVVFLPVIFLVAAVAGFCTGTSWGTFAIMLPIAVPAAISLDLPPAPFIAAALSGGVFGDHASPISDTSVVSSMAAATDHIDHVRTQLPYALLAAGVATVGFAIVGAVM